jgi:hypothetical protein
MSSNLLTWLSSGLIALVLGITLWLAHAIHPEHEGLRVLVAQAVQEAQEAQAPGTAASAPTVRR